MRTITFIINVTIIRTIVFIIDIKGHIYNIPGSTYEVLLCHHMVTYAMTIPYNILQVKPRDQT